jgi:hypothetical protein
LEKVKREAEFLRKVMLFELWDFLLKDTVFSKVASFVPISIIIGPNLQKFIGIENGDKNP